MFDDPDELLEKIRLGEDTEIEFKTVQFKGDKVSDPKRDALGNEIAAMANTHDGVLVLGVDDETRDIVGIPADRLDDVERYVHEICRDAVKPPVHFRAFRMELPDRSGEPKPILKIEIPRSLFVHKSSGGYYRRQGSAIQELAPDALARLFQQRSQANLIRFDEQPVPETALESLDNRLIEKFTWRDMDDDLETLHKLKILTRDEQGRERATVAGVLMCSRNPQKWLTGATIQAVRYRGVRQDSNYQVDAQEMTGPLDEQVSSAFSFVRKNMRMAARKDPARVETPQYSLRAVFEAIVNAVAHRDYSIHGSKIRLFMFDDRFELYSPGPLPNSVTVESIALRQSTRNELLTTMLAKCPFEDPGKVGRNFMMEKRGDGVPIIFKESKESSGIEPVYRLIDDTELLLTIYSSAPTEVNAEDEDA